MTDYEEIGKISMEEAQVMPFFILKDSRSFQNIERFDFT